MIYVFTMGLIQRIGVENIPIMLAVIGAAIPGIIIGIRKEDKEDAERRLSH